MIIKADSDKAMFLMSNRKKSNCIGIRIILRDNIDGEKLQQAVNITMNRYSYLNVRFVEKIKPYYEENPQPFTVKNVQNLNELAGPETDYHLLAFTYFEKTIKVYFNHAIVDGGGIFTVIRTLLFYYAKFHYDSNLSSEGIITAETPFNEDEIKDTYEIVKKMKIPNLDKKQIHKDGKINNVFTIKDSRLISLNSDKLPGKIFYIKVSSDQMMEVCHKYNMTPATLVSLLLARSIRKLHPEAENLTGGLSMSFRKNINCESLKNSIVPMTIEFTKEMSELPFNEQCSLCRKQVLIHQEKCVQLNMVKRFVGMVSILKELPYTKFTKKILGKMLEKIMSETFQISYTGQSRFGAAEKYVEAVLIDYEMPATGITIEMTAVNHSIFLCYGQKFEEKIYLNAFLDELNALNISEEVIQEKKAEVPSLYSVK